MLFNTLIATFLAVMASGVESHPLEVLKNMTNAVTPAFEISNSGPTPAPDPDPLRYSVGYVASWTVDRKCNVVKPSDIDASAYTHLIFSFAIIDENFKLAINKTTEATYLRGLISHVNHYYRGVKVVIAVGGWTFNDPGPTQDRFTNMVASAANRKTFIDSSIKLIHEFGASGLDLDWEYPTASDRGGREGDADNYVSLVREMRAAFPSKFSISAAMPVGWSGYYPGFKAAEMAPYLDFMVSMAYDLHGIWEYSAADGGKLAAHTDMRDVIRGINTTEVSGVPKNKILLGLAFYGRSFKQLDPARTNLGDPFVDPKIAVADPGPCTDEAGFLSFGEISDIIQKNSSSIRRNTYESTTVTNIFAYGQDQWLSYDTEMTIAKRVEYAHGEGLAGTSVWSIDLDNKKRQLSNSIKQTRRKLGCVV